MTNFTHVLSLLSGLKLQGIAQNIEAELNEAEAGKHSYLNFFKAVLESEITWRRERKLKRNLAGAHFPAIKQIDDFDPRKVKGITKTDIANLLDLRWLDNHENILFFGPPGVGKTHMAISLGMKAVETGYTVCFERMTNLVRLLKSTDIQRRSLFRINRLNKVDLVIIDEIGYTPIERKEANLFFNLVSELYEKSSLIITSNKNFDDWAEMLGDRIMTTALLDRLLHHAKVFSLDGESYRIKQKKEEK
jgi:DNA replication protein DnaC